MSPTRRTFLKRLGLGAGGLFLSHRLPRAWALDQPRLLRSTPAAEGVAAEGILAFLEATAAQKFELHSFLLARHGRVVAEGWWAPYAPSLRHTMYSMSKSFTSTAAGLAVAEGKLRVEDRVVGFFPKELPEAVSENLAALRVQDLLTMSVGNEKEPTGPVTKEENWVRAFLAQPISHTPGTVFLYNSAATYMVSAIVQQVTGERIVDYLRPRLFEPLGIQNVAWETCPRGINTGGWGLSVPTEALAKFGQLYLQKGMWHGRELLPAQWIEEATRFHIQQPAPAQPKRPNEQNDWLQGYGYQFWRCQHRAFRGDGAFGQFTIVLPEQDAVIAMTSENGNMQGQLDLVWEHLLPAMKDRPVADDPALQRRLNETLSSLALNPPAGQRTSPTAARVSGKTFQIEKNDLGLQSVSFAFQPDTTLFNLRDPQREYPISCGFERWTNGETSVPGTPPRLLAGGAPKPGTPFKIAASGTWKNERTFEMTWRYYETPHHDTVTCTFDGDQVTVAFLSSVARMRNLSKDSRPALIGRLAG
jgi:CubicO group peptidase (beta-lactamase class C family)